MTPPPFIPTRTVLRVVEIDDIQLELAGESYIGGPAADIADLIASGQEVRAIVRLATTIKQARASQVGFIGERAYLAPTPMAYYAAWAPKKRDEPSTHKVVPNKDLAWHIAQAEIAAAVAKRKADERAEAAIDAALKSRTRTRRCP
jgi:hypothetical protein